MADLDPPDDIRVYFNGEHRSLGWRPDTPVSPKPIPGPRFWTLRSLALEMRRNPPDVLFVPSHVIPPVHPASVVTVHDLGYLVEPDCHEPMHRKQLDWTTRWNCHAARGIIAVSDATRSDLDPAPRCMRLTRFASSITASLRCSRPATQHAVARARADYALPERFVLAVGTIHPRKNLVTPHSGVRADGFRHARSRAGSLRRVGLASARNVGTGRPQPIRESDPSHRLCHEMPISQPSIPQRRSRHLSRSMRDLACPPWNRWPAGRRWSQRTGRRCPKFAGERRCSSTQTILQSISTALSRVLDDPQLRQSMVERGRASVETIHLATLRAPNPRVLARDSRQFDLSGQSLGR